MRFAVALLFLVLGSVCDAADMETWFISNRLGMRLESIPRYRADEFDYVVCRTGEGGATVTTLLGRAQEITASSSSAIPAGLEEVSRWERSTDAHGLIEERVFDHGTHVSTGVYGTDGRLQRETLYVDGVASEALEYRYAGALIRSVESRSQAGQVLWTVTYDVSRAGLLRAVSRTGAEPATAGYGFGGAHLQEEYLQSPEHTVVLRYDPAGHRVVWELLEGGSLARATYSEYDPATGRLTREEDRAGADERTERTYDEEGRLVREALFRAKKEIWSVDCRYDAAGRLISSERLSEAGRDLTTYGYGTDGTLEWEELRERGALRRRIVHTGPSSRYEDIIQSDRLILRVSYEGEEKVHEDVIRDGKVLRSRALGGAAP